MGPFNRIILYPNRKATHPKAPQYVGHGLVEVGEAVYETRVAAWTVHPGRPGNYVTVDIRVDPNSDPMNQHADTEENEQ